MPKVSSRAAVDAYGEPDTSNPAGPGAPARQHRRHGATHARPPGMPGAAPPQGSSSVPPSHARSARRPAPRSRLPQPAAEGSSSTPAPRDDGGWHRLLGQLGPLDDPPSSPLHYLTLQQTAAGPRLAWVPAAQRNTMSDAAAAGAKAHLKAVVNEAIRALPDADEHAPGILFPEQDYTRFRPDAGPLDANDVIRLAGKIEQRLARYATPPAVTLPMPPTPEHRGSLLPFLDAVAPGSYLSAYPDGRGGIVMTSRLARTPGPAEDLARQALMQMFDHAWAALAGRGTDLPPQQLQDLKEDFAGDALTAGRAVALLDNIPLLAQDRRLSTQRDDVDAPPAKPTPTEAIAWLVDLADRGARMSAGSPGYRQAFTQLGQRAQQFWLTDGLDTASTIGFLTTMQQGLQTTADPLLGRAATAIGGKIAGLQSHGAAGPAATRLHDNVNGRRWESAFAEALAEHPSPAMLQAAGNLRQLLSAVLATCTPAQQQAITENAVNRIESAYPGHWLAGDMDTARLRQRPDDARALRAFLSHPVMDGVGCMATYLVACRVLAAMQEEVPDVATWKDAADENYERLLDERGPEKFPEDSFQEGPDVGLLMRHQISPNFVNYDEEEDVRGVLSSVTDFEARTAEIDTALRTGRPSVWGSSGTTNLLLHFLADAAAKPATAHAVAGLDIDHMILGLATMVMRDGGHSLREVLRVLEQTADRLPPPVRRPLDASPAPASHYGAFFSRFRGNAETLQRLTQANGRAWQSTLEYRRELRP